MMKDVKLTTQTIQVLAELLDDDKPRYGLELARTLSMKSGTLYPILTRLAEAGWVERTWESIDPTVERRPRRRYYQLTPDGRAGSPARIQAALGPAMAGWSPRPEVAT